MGRGFRVEGRVMQGAWFDCRVVAVDPDTGAKN